MSAEENFARFNAELDAAARMSLTESIKHATEELLAARSEDARIRIVEEYIRDANTSMKR